MEAKTPPRPDSGLSPGHRPPEERGEFPVDISFGQWPTLGQHLGLLDKVTRVVRLGVAVATSGDVREQPRVADGASELLQDVFGKDKNPSRLVYGVASLPLGTPVELELIFEVS